MQISFSNMIMPLLLLSAQYFLDNSSFTQLTLILKEDWTISLSFILPSLFCKCHDYLLAGSDTFILLLNYKTIVSLSSSNIPFTEVRYLMDCLSRNRHYNNTTRKAVPALTKTLNTNGRNIFTKVIAFLVMMAACSMHQIWFVCVCWSGAQKCWHKDPTSIF